MFRKILNLRLLILIALAARIIYAMESEKPFIAIPVKIQLTKLLQSELVNKPENISKRSNHKLKQLIDACVFILQNPTEQNYFVQALKINNNQLIKALERIKHCAQNELDKSAITTENNTQATNKELAHPVSLPVAQSKIHQQPSITLVSNDDKEFKIVQNIVEFSKTIKLLISEVGTSESIPLNVSSENLSIILDHLKIIEKLRSDDRNFKNVYMHIQPLLKNFSQQKLIDLLLIANYLDIPPLLYTYGLAFAMTISPNTFTTSYGNYRHSQAETLLGKTIPAEMVKYIISFEDAIWERTLKFFTLLNGKKSVGKITQAKHLIDQGIYLDRVSAEQKTPLIKAIAELQNEIALELIKAGANVNATDQNGRTPLMKLAEFGRFYENQLEVVNALIKANANLNARDNSNNTALIIARNTGHKALVQKLIKSGAK